MKKITLILSAVLFAGLTLISCGGGGGAKEAATSFINAMNKLDFKSARNYASDSTKVSLDKVLDQMKNLTPDQKKQYDDEVAKRSKVTLTIKDVKENGDKATVTFTTSEDPSRLDSVPMVKQGGKWVADLKMW